MNNWVFCTCVMYCTVVNGFCGKSLKIFAVFANRRMMAGQKINSILFVCLGMYSVFCAVLFFI